MSFVIRRFSRRDQRVARRLVLEGLGEHFGVINETLNTDLNDIHQAYIAAGHEFFLAEFDDAIVGTVGLVFEPKCARIVRMSVARSHRRRGVAKALLNRCIETARSHRLPEIIAFTEPHWRDAVAFYTGAGFHEYGRDGVDIHLRLTLD
jgi:GNAT superfamily N-acetyltransferase